MSSPKSDSFTSCSDSPFLDVRRASFLHGNPCNTIVTLPLVVKCVHWFPLDHGHRLRHATALLLISLILAIAVSLSVWATIFYTWFPYRSFYPTFLSLLEDKFVWFLQGEILLAFGLVAVLVGRRVWLRFQAEKKRASELEGQLAQARL